MAGIDGRIRVMVVDDNAAVRTSMRIFLKAFSEFSFVGEACDGWDAIRLSHALHPDVILMDINMPVMDGLQATDIIHRDLPETQIIMLTNSQDPLIDDRVRSAHATNYLNKYSSIDDIARAIKACKVI